MEKKELVKWIAGIIATVIAGVLVWWLTQGIKPEPTPIEPSRTLSFLESAAGTYSLASWTQANRPISIGIKILEGEIEIDSNGTANWNVLVEQAQTSDPGRVRMTARGKIDLNNKELVGVPGGEYNNTHYLDNKWGQISSDVGLAVRGWELTGATEDKFKLSIDNQGNDRQILQMTNSRGTFVWVK